MKHARLIVAAICLAGLLLRLIGLQFGLPAVYNPDEVAIMARALTFAKGSLNPHNFLYPTFYFYVLFAWVGVYLASLLVTGRVASVGALQQLYFTSPTGIYTAGRALGVAAGTATIAALYRLGDRIGGTRTGIAAAVFLAVSPLHVRDSHYVKHDVPATLAVVVACLMMARVWPSDHGSTGTAARSVPPLRDTILAGAATGIAFSTHYYTIFLALPLAWVILWRTRGHGVRTLVRHLAAAALTSAIVFFALSPFLLVEPLTAWRDIRANRQIVVDRAIAGGAFGPAVRYAEMLWQDSTGIPVIVLAAAGIAWMTAVDWRRALFLLAFPVPFLAFIANTAPASRYLNPVLPFVALFAGWAVTQALRHWRPSDNGPVFWAVLAAAALPGAWASLRADLFFRATDTRTLAQAFIERRVPSGSGILIQPYSVALTPSRESLAEALARNVGSAEAASTKFQLQLSLKPYPEPSYRLVYLGSGGLDADKRYVSLGDVGSAGGLERLQELGVAFVVFKRYNKSDPGSLPFLAALERGARRIAAFTPYRPGVSEAEQARVDPFLHNTDTRIDDALERPGPPLEIWQLDGSGARQP